MTSRLLKNTLPCLLVLSSFLSWDPVTSVTVKGSPKGPATVEAQAKFFQDFFSVQLSPYKMEFGHVCEDPNTWEQRYEKKDFKNHRDMGKVRWGDKQGGYGEHYWDLNHAGHGGGQSNDNDDGSYNSQEHNDPYDEPSDQVSTFNDEYDAEKASQSPFDENNRAKRAQPRLRQDKDGEIVYGKRKTKDLHRKNREAQRKKKQEEEEEKASEESKSVEEEDEQDNSSREEQPAPQRKNKVTTKFGRFKPKEINYDDDSQSSDSPLHTTEPEQTDYHDQKSSLPRKNNYDNDQANQPQNAEQKHSQRNPYAAVADAVAVANQQENYRPTQTLTVPYVPYESGAGIRQHYERQFAAAPRLFLDPSTGNVVDRATGQAYVLQPIGVKY